MQPNIICCLDFGYQKMNLTQKETFLRNTLSTLRLLVVMSLTAVSLELGIQCLILLLELEQSNVSPCDLVFVALTGDVNINLFSGGLCEGFSFGVIMYIRALLQRSGGRQSTTVSAAEEMLSIHHYIWLQLFFKKKKKIHQLTPHFF